MNALVQRGYPVFASSALLEREQVQLPPFCSLALLRAEATERTHSESFARNAREVGLEMACPGVVLRGPVPAPMERRAGRYRMHVLVEASLRAELQGFLGRWIPILDQVKSARRVRWSVDVDPQDML